MPQRLKNHRLKQTQHLHGTKIAQNAFIGIKQYLVPIRFMIWCQNLYFCSQLFFCQFVLLTFTFKTASLKHFPTKCQEQNDHVACAVISCVVKIWTLQLGLLLKSQFLLYSLRLPLLHLINSFCRRYVSCMYHISNKYAMYPKYIPFTRGNLKNRFSEN